MGKFLVDLELLLAFPSNLRTCSWPIALIILIFAILKLFDKKRKLMLAENRALKLALLALANRDELLLAYRELIGELAEKEARWRSDDENKARLLGTFVNSAGVDMPFRQRVVKYFQLNVVV